VGLGRKLFLSGFAKGASSPILEQQKNDLDLLQDKLRQIATHNLTMAQQQLSGEQAMERTELQQEQANQRSLLTQKGLNRRAADTRRANVEARAADAGVPVHDRISSIDILNNVASVNRAILEAETEADAQKAVADRVRLSADIAAKSGMAIPDAVWDDPASPAALAFFRNVATVAQQRFDNEHRLKIPPTVLAAVKDMGAPGAAVIDQLLAEHLAAGRELTPEYMAEAMAARWSAIGPRAQQEGISRAMGMVNSMRSFIIRKNFPDGKIPTGVDAEFPEAKALIAQTREELAAMENNPNWQVALQRVTRYTQGALNLETPLTPIEMNETLALDALYQNQAEVDDATRGAIGDLSFPAQGQQNALMKSVNFLIETVTPYVIETGDMAELEKVAFVYEELAVTEERPPGQEHLTSEDYTQAAQFVREQIRQLEFEFLKGRYSDPAANPQETEVPRQFGQTQEPAPRSPTIGETAQQFLPTLQQQTGRR
jgi:hypothetical protein